MLIAQQKRKENIAEYILYLFQIEDIIRAFEFDMEKINLLIVAGFKGDDETKKEIYDWYNNLVVMMQKEGLTEKGHLQFIKNLINELNQIHYKIINSNADEKYSTLYKTTSGLINEFKQKTSAETGDIETCINALYGYLMLKVQKKTISNATQDAMDRFSSLLAQFAVVFGKIESGELEL